MSSTLLSVVSGCRPSNMVCIILLNNVCLVVLCICPAYIKTVLLCVPCDLAIVTSFCMELYLPIVYSRILTDFCARYPVMISLVFLRILTSVY
jgi:hypothetical protein